MHTYMHTRADEETMLLEDDDGDGAAEYLLVDKYETFLLDMDGVLWEGGEVLPGGMCVCLCVCVYVCVCVCLCVCMCMCVCVYEFAHCI